MKFVDEATVRVQAGNGGPGCLSFRREKNIPRGGPDGGDGGNGGSVWLVAQAGINTLVDFRVNRRYRATSGEPGAGRNRTGRSGEDLEIAVPLGTRVVAEETGELLGDLSEDGQRLLVAAGGEGGKGNTRFKSSTNQAPRRTTPGTSGEARSLLLELLLLADVGLLGKPNAGKSTLIRAVSAARPRVADYPFTTLHPNLGVVYAGPQRSFVMADIPGLIKGAADGAGLGIRFLRHLERSRLLLHVVDLAPPPGTTTAGEDAAEIIAELAAFGRGLAERERWLVLNKTDLLDPQEAARREAEVLAALAWTGPVYRISALSGEGTARLTGDVMTRLEALERPAEADVGADEGT